MVGGLGGGGLQCGGVLELEIEPRSPRGKAGVWCVGPGSLLCAHTLIALIGPCISLFVDGLLLHLV